MDDGAEPQTTHQAIVVERTTQPPSFSGAEQRGQEIAAQGTWMAGLGGEWRARREGLLGRRQLR